jgi:hypothetical protein
MRRNFCLFVALSLVLGAVLFAADQPAVTSGRAVGEITPSFVVLDVTGPHKGEAICYVCEYRGAPTVLGFFQDSGDETASLIMKLNELAIKEANKNLKAVAVVVSGPDKKPWLEKLAQDKGIKIPLVVFRKGKDDLNVKLYKLNLQAKNTFLVSLNREVSANLTNVSDQTFSQVTEATSKMLVAASKKPEEKQP